MLSLETVVLPSSVFSTILTGLSAGDNVFVTILSPCGVDVAVLAEVVVAPAEEHAAGLSVGVDSTDSFTLLMFSARRSANSRLLINSSSTYGKLRLKTFNSFTNFEQMTDSMKNNVS